MELCHGAGVLVRWIMWISSSLALATGLGCDRQQSQVAAARPAREPARPVAASSAPPPALSGARAPRSQVETLGLRVRTGTVPDRALWTFTELALDLRRTRLEVVARSGGAALNELLPSGGLAVVNGGYFDANYRPSTWVKSGGVELARKSPTTKGGVMALLGERLFIGPMASLPFEPELAVQNFPLIVELDGRAGIRTDDGRRAARTIACVAQGELHFIILTAPLGEGPTLYESVALLREAKPRGFGCHTALNLDGGPSTGVWFAPSIPTESRLPLTPVAYGIAILPR